MGESKKVLIVDDIEVNRIILQEILSDSYEIDCADGGVEAISKLINSPVKPSLVLLDIMMPEVDGFEVMKYIKANDTLSKIPVIFITAADQEIEGLSMGAVDYISKPFVPEIVKIRVSNHIELSLYREQLEIMVEEKANELIVTKETFLHTMADLIEYRSLESSQHVQRTKELTKILVSQMISNEVYHDELKNQNLRALIDAVPLHDIGKIGIPDRILLKPGKLTPEEYDIIKTHTTIGASVIESLLKVSNDDYLKYCYDICRFHHERWDGNGYPDGREGKNIPLAARIVSVVDVYDALTSERCYKKDISHADAIEIIKSGSGSQFDPEIIGLLLVAQDKFQNCLQS